MNSQRTTLAFECKRKALNRLGLEREALRQRILNGTFPPGVPIAHNRRAWLSHEIDQMLAALAGDMPEEEQRKLVARIVADRKRLPSLFGAEVGVEERADV